MPLEGRYEPSPWAWVRDQVAAYEASGGERGGTMQGLPVIVLTTRGARSGVLRKSPLMRVEHQGAYLAVGSMGGAPNDPQWCRNLRAYAFAEVQDGDSRWDVTARELEGDERAAWWDRAVEAFPTYAAYQRETSRRIPLFLLEPATASPPSAG